MKSNRTSSFPADLLNTIINVLLTASALMSIASCWLVLTGHTLSGFAMVGCALVEVGVAMVLRRTFKPKSNKSAGT